MAHTEQQNFFRTVKEKFPNKFKNCSVLDIGSLDINGNNRFLFEDYTYIGVDISEGNNVDVISKGHEYNSEILFDIVISSECFEHDMYYPETIRNCINLTKNGGLFTFTCASTGRPEHGTRRTDTYSSPLTTNIDEWADYYKNLTEDDIREVVDIDEIFENYQFEYVSYPGDLYFWGIKK